MPFLEYRGTVFPLEAGVVLGRGSQCSLRLQDIDASRRHARAWCQGEKVMVQDLGSRNGTYLNGRPVDSQSPITLADGDVLRIGKDEVRYWQHLPEQDELDHTTVHVPAVALHQAGSGRAGLSAETTLPPET